MLRENLWAHWLDIGYHYNDTTCIHSNNLDLIEENINSIFEQEGYINISKPSLPQNSKPLIKELLARPWLIRSLFIIGLLNGNNNWTTIKTSKSKLFCHTAKYSTRPKLSELAVKSGCDAFHHHIEKRYCGVLLEANSIGQTLASGYVDYDDIDQMVFLNEPVIKLTKETKFLLLNVSEELKAAGKIKVTLSEGEKQKKEEELEALFNEKPYQAQRALSEWKELHTPLLSLSENCD